MLISLVMSHFVSELSHAKTHAHMNHLSYLLSTDLEYHLKNNPFKAFGDPSWVRWKSYLAEHKTLRALQSWQVIEDTVTKLNNRA